MIDLWQADYISKTKIDFWVMIDNCISDKRRFINYFDRLTTQVVVYSDNFFGF